jgi:hypothetical protein
MLRKLSWLAALLAIGCAENTDESTSDLIATGAWRDTGVHHMTEHAAFLSNGQLLLWGLAEDTKPALWNPRTNAFRRIPQPSGEVLYNSGHLALPDGRLLLVGGGTRQRTARTYDPAAPAGVTPWGSLGGGLVNPRFYPTALLLPSGQVLVASGDYLTGPDPGAGPSASLPAEIYDPPQNRWVPIVDHSQDNERLPSFDLFPAMYVLPSGHIVALPVANDVSGRVKAPALLALDGPRVTHDSFGEVRVGETAVEAPSTTNGWEPLAMQLRRRTNGSTVLLIDDTQPTTTARVLAVGDGGTSELIDFSDETHPTVSEQTLNFRRDDHPGLVPLPNGTVLLLDGNGSTPVPPEIFDGTTWKQAGPAPKFRRNYHNVAVLLPEGHVVVSSDGVVNTQPARVTNQTMEIYAPGYMNEPRPTIANAPAMAAQDDVIAVTTTTSVESIAFASLVRPASITHGTDSSQRYIKLEITREAGSLRVTLPAPNVAPAGDYYLHIVDDRGVPSPGRVLRLKSE